MGRYGIGVYGTALYGPEAAGDVDTIWLLDIDWDGDGEFDGSNEADYLVDLRIERGRKRMLEGDKIAPMGIGRGSLLLDNSGRRYDPYNTSSPLYPNVKPGRQFRIRAQDASDATIYEVMEGVVSDIVPVDINGVPHARLLIEDGMRWMDNKLTGATTLESDDIQTIVEWIVDDVDSPWSVSADDSALQTSETRLYWYTWKRSAYLDLQEMADAEGGVVFHGKDGTFYFYNRDHTYNRTKAVDEDVLLRDIAVPQPWDIIRNSVECEFNSKSVQDVDFPGVTANVLWQKVGGSQSWVFMPDGETTTLDVTFKYEDYRMAGYNERENGFSVEEADGGGIITNDCTMTWDEPVGGGTRIHLANNAGEDGYATALEMAGDVVIASYTGTRVAEDTNSQSTYGIRSLKVGSYWTEWPDKAKEIADWLLYELKDPTIHPVIRVEGRPDYQFYFDLWDRVELTLGTLGISGNFRVGGIEHEFTTPTGQGVLTTFYLEPYIPPFDSYTRVKASDSGLVSWWKLEEPEGTTRYDAIGSNHLTENNGVGRTSPAKQGDYAADFERSDSDYLSITDGDQSGLDITGDFSCCFWIKPESDGFGDITGKNDYTTDKSWEFYKKSNNHIVARFSSNGSDNNDAEGASAYESGEWSHFAVVYNGTDIRIYKDGELDSNGADNPKTYSSGIYNSGAPFLVGCYFNAGVNKNHYDGLVDDLMVFNRALSAEEVKGIYLYGLEE